MAKIVEELNLEGLTISKFYDFGAERALRDYAERRSDLEKELKEYLSQRV
ncbi:hypothetical protein MYX82_13150 [Acidobacteria bacterium AH-259-D05]|nr:hypothetical protein [Acidobacteria bacterium AH-259-D05]